MNIPEPPPEAHRYRRSQTPESPRPLHLPEPSNIPVLQNQMDPVFNDTNTYDILPDTQSFTDANQATASLFDHARQHNLNAHNQDGVEKNNEAGHMMSGNHFTENKSISQVLSDTSPNANASSTQPIFPSGPHSAHQPTYLPHYDNPYHGLADSSTPAQNSFHQPDDKYDEATGPVQIHSAEAGGQIGGQQSRSSANQPSGDSTYVEQKQEKVPTDEGVNYQSLLDNLSQSTAIAPVAESFNVPTTAEPDESTALSHSGAETALPAAAGLPPRPPPQEKPTIHPNYSANESIRSYHQLPTPNTNASSYSTQLSPYRQDTSTGMPPVNVAPIPTTTFRAANGLPPPPALSTFQQPPQDATHHQSPSVQLLHDREIVSSPGLRGGPVDEDIRWGPDIQAKYDQFLNNERNYVTEGVWDRFPPGSRLFVGNLPTEKVTKRDLFHVFHKHGKLAQISIKQAYGFVQFLEASACFDALDKEQGEAIRGRKIHLEISKPQKNTRNSGPAERTTIARRRSRSPARRGGSRSSSDRFERASYTETLPFSDYRDEPTRRRDEYRPMRSPSPRAYRARDEYRARERSPGIQSRWSSHSIPGQFGGAGGGFRPPSPKVFDDDAALPLPRREPRDVPDVQMLILEEVAPDFVNYIEQGFRSKGLRAQTIWLNPRITLAAVIKRQIIEGVQAVVKLTRNSQYSTRIPLQVFDRSAGASNVNFNEYVELEVHVAADIVISARQKERMAASVPTPALYPPSNSFSVPPQQYPYAQQQSQPSPSYAQPQHHPSLSYPQHQSQPSQIYLQHQPPIPPPQQYAPQHESTYHSPAPANQGTRDGAPNLQELLANLRQPSNPPSAVSPQTPMQATSRAPTDLAGLLSNVARQQSQGNGYTQQQPQQSSVNQYSARPPLQTYPNPSGMPHYGGAPQPPQQNVQNIMDQLARWNK